MHRVVAVLYGVAGLWFLLLASPRSLGEAAVKYAFAAILLFFAYRRFRASSTNAAEYVRREEGTWLQLTVSPASPPILWFPAVLSIILGAGVVGSGMAYLWVPGLIVAFLAWLVLLKDHRGGNPGAPRSFRVNPEGIETDGTFLRKDDIHNLRIRNKFAGGARSSTTPIKVFRPASRWGWRVVEHSPRSRTGLKSKLAARLMCWLPDWMR